MPYRNTWADLCHYAVYVFFFAVAFIPLWVTLLAICWTTGACSECLVAVLLIPIVGLLIGLGVYLKKLNLSKKHKNFKVIKKDDITYSLAFYIFPYVSALYIKEFTTMEAIPFAIVLAIVGLLYVKTNMLHVNPVLMVCGYRMYRVTDDHSNTIVLMSRLNVLTNVDVACVEIAPNISMVLDQE